MIQFSDTTIEDERLKLDSNEHLYYLGHHLTLRRCHLIIKVPRRALVIFRTQLIDCTIDVKKELKGFRWEGVILKGCQFSGAMTGNDFGRWPYAEQPELGSIEDCDFTNARLDACRFINCDLSRVKLPSWPCFSILSPAGRKNELLAHQWPGTMHITVDAFTEGPAETAAVTYFAPAVAKRNDTTPEAIRAVLDTLPGVIL
ncbi:pentapeptide repeat-containing protein [Pyxidicoccus parkwayensis]|uniref:pentapeptide repeat-containing protein n=1 Tax=Pyxidicoccus parkwayensis TaxID=2813578 RepID=UPI001F50EF4F|nr:pentapeptide repeat-containing protein [Pyxidicoccus parkwaysis]